MRYDPAMDALENAIAEKRAERDGLARRIEHLDVEISALELASSLRPGTSQRTLRVSGSSKGRQPGAISEKWRNILQMMHGLHPLGAPDDDLLEICRAEGLENIRQRDVTRRMGALGAHGYVERSQHGWMVTQAAIRRFNISNDQVKRANDFESSALLETTSMS